MKRHLLTNMIALLAIVCPQGAHGLPATQAWAQRYSNPVDSDDQATRVVTDSADNVIVAGWTDEGVTGPDMLIIKYSNTGVAMWTNRYNGPGNDTDQPTAVAVDGSGNVFVTGLSYGGGSYFDYVTIAYSSAGAPLWTNRYDGPANGADYAAGLALDANGDVIVTGSSFGLGTSDDFVTIKYSNAGVPLWTNRYNGPANESDGALAVAVDGSGNVFVTGYSYSGTSYDYATIAYSSVGVPLWVNRYNGPGDGDDEALAIAADGSGNVFVTGYSDGGGFNFDYATVAYSSAGTPLWTNRYDFTGGDDDEAYAIAAAGTNVYVTGFSYSGTTYDYATIAYSSAGAPLWTNRYNGPANSDDEAFALAVDGNGNVFVTGFSVGGASGNDYATVAYSSAGMVLWITRYNGPGDGTDQAQAVAADSSGNVFVTGYSDSGTSSDWATIKYSSIGVASWTNRYNGPGNSDDSAQAVAVDGGGNIVVTGYSVGNGSGYDYATVKYSSTGLALWTNRYNGPGFNPAEANAVAVDGSGNVFVTGYVQDSFNGPDYLTIAYSSAGVALWTNHYNGPGSGIDVAQAVAVNGSGDVVVTGYSDSGTNGYDYLTIAYSGGGVALWTNRYNGPGNSTDQAQALAVDGSGNVFVTGYAASETNGDDYVTIKYSSAGVPLWTNRYDGPTNGADQAQAVAVDGSGNVVVTGTSYSGTSEDYATIAYSSAGLPLWTNRYDGPGNNDDEARAVAVDGAGNVFVTGYSRGTSSGDDYATIAYSSAGVALWTNRYNGPGNYDDDALAVAVDGSGTVYVTGYSYGGGGSITIDFATIAYSTAGVALWTNRYNGPFNGADRPLTSRCMAVAGNGSVVVVGQTPGRYSGNGAYDYATVKYVTVPEVRELQTGTPGPNMNTLTFAGAFNNQYIAQFATNLSGSPWFNLSTNTAATNGLWTVIDPAATNAERYYRVLTP